MYLRPVGLWQVFFFVKIKKDKLFLGNTINRTSKPNNIKL